MTSKERACLKSQAVKIEPVLQIGKAGVTPELTEAVSETFNTRELTKIHILQSCTEDGRAMAQTLADRTASEVVQVIGRMIVLYKKNNELQKKQKSEKTTVHLQQKTESGKSAVHLQQKTESGKSAVHLQQRTKSGKSAVHGKKIARTK